MVLGLDLFDFNHDGRGDESGIPHLLPTTSRRSTHKIHTVTGDESLATFKQYRKIRPYVRSSMHKLKWTLDLHQCFMGAVNRLGGKDKATPKRIVQCMGRDRITIAHVKSHLQMLRMGRINEEGMSNADAVPVADRHPHDSESCMKNLSSTERHANLLREAVEVLKEPQLQKYGLIFGAAEAEMLQRRVADSQALQRHKACEYDQQASGKYWDSHVCPEVPLDDECATGRYRNDEEPLQLNLTMAIGAPHLRHH
ncbi:uncharacterized protein [Physcomitrium patens]|uniref:Myb-like domain-containing protein n=1 Tax=Physcomitrium patens TaxID=3218 RepID=A9RW47_PHYPA|nr:myb family transcription factor PHL8-like [Physcomitrium patens]PNR47206.1 hypothetical protein PHYPA_014326 [Physcomitrium patens]|eukprot:XP_024387570.1 myb family transcription factor PHL8-like [Physcomitrella patens]